MKIHWRHARNHVLVLLAGSLVWGVPMWLLDPSGTIATVLAVAGLLVGSVIAIAALGRWPLLTWEDRP